MRLNKISSVFNINKFAKSNVAIFGATLTAMLAMPTYAAEAEAATAVESRDDIEVIQVTGMLGSMKAAAVLKRSDGRIVDAIVAEDIGKLPDNNIAEALSRITGVSVNTDFGVGNSVSIRGLSQNRVELNGRSTIGDSRDGVSLQDFPSSFLKTVEVVKSPTADMIEGALGGTVSMKTVRPLELEKLTGAMSLDAEYADKTENVAPIFSGMLGNNWDLGSAGSFGASVMLAYQDRELRQDQYTSKTAPVDGTINGEAGNTASGNYILRNEHSIEQYVENRERTAINLALQWAPESGNGMVYLEVAGTERSGQQAGNSILGVGGKLNDTSSAGIHQTANGVNNYTLENEFAIPKTYSDFRETKSFSNALGAEWNISESILISGEIAVASSESVRPDSEFTLRPIDRVAVEAGGSTTDYYRYDGTFNQVGNELPSITHSDYNAELGYSEALINPQYLALRTFKSQEKLTDNDEIAVRFDIEIDEPFNIDWLTTIKAGVRATERDYDYYQATVEIKDIYKESFDADTGEVAALWIDDHNAMFPGSFTQISHANSFDQAGNSGGRNDLLTFATYNGLSNPSAAFEQVKSLLASVNSNLTPTGTLAENLAAGEDTGSFRDITEKTTALYASFYLDFDELTAIVGGRYVMTDLSSAIKRTDDDGQVYLVDGENDYADFLPSLNVSYSLTDDTVVRFAAAKVMRRADFSELSPAFDVNNDITGATQGSIGLDPYRASQLDLSIEHYFGEGNMLSFAVFYKDVESFFTNEKSCVADASTSGQNVTQWNQVCQLDTVGVTQTTMNYSSVTDFPGSDSEAEGLAYVEGLQGTGYTGIDTETKTNGENGSIQGFEIGYQQHFDFLPGAWSGLGVSTNYTYADSEQPNGSPLLEISKNTFNFQGFWEYEGFGLRLAYNFRSDFLESENEKRVENINENGDIFDEDDLTDTTVYGNNYRDDRGQLDFSASWDINEHFTVVANASNLTGEPSIYKSELGGSWKITEADRRYTIGVRAKF